MQTGSANSWHGGSKKSQRTRDEDTRCAHVLHEERASLLWLAGDRSKQADDRAACLGTNGQKRSNGRQTDRQRHAGIIARTSGVEHANIPRIEHEHLRGRHRKTSLEGKGVCMKRPKTASGIDSRMSLRRVHRFPMQIVRIGTKKEDVRSANCERSIGNKGAYLGRSRRW